MSEGLATAPDRPIQELIGVLQGAEIELAENDGYDLCRPLGIRVAINSLLAGLGVEPKDLEGEVGTAVDAALVVCGHTIKVRVDSNQREIEQLREALKGVAIMLNTQLSRYEEEPWAKRVRAALTPKD